MDALVPLASASCEVERLHNELLSTIFMFAVQQYNRETDSSTTSPMTISHICHRWRQVALETGDLWSNIVLTFPPSNQQLSRTQTWLLRSTTYPLEILLDFRDPDWDWDEETHQFRGSDMEAVLRLLVPTASRWRSIELLTDTWAPIFAFLLHTRSISGSLAQLKSLHLARCNAYFARKGQIFEPAALGQYLPLFGGEEGVVQRLREVTLTGVHINWLAPPFSNLTKLELKYQAADVMPTVAELTEILVASPNLEVLAIVGCGPRFVSAGPGVSGDPNGPALLGVVRLARLTGFTVGFVDVHDVLQLIALFDLPALCELTLEDVSVSLRHQPPDDVSVLLEWLATSTSRYPLNQLHTLVLRSIHAPCPSFAQLYDACPALHVLRLYDVCDSALEALQHRDEPKIPDILPQLDALFARGKDKGIFFRVVSERGFKQAEFEVSTMIE
ncbi:F-box domain-containing protein [Mycena venus]|uniref:F-box domain-containing protein n=1 Tax=Mycena venus TaxID=2733690 RepID=A0A8H6XMX3_9AGAR|nr:F-box domain-containing protein [Mycena venus]